LLTHVPANRPVEPPGDVIYYDTTDEAAALVSDLDSLHVTVNPLTRVASATPETTSPIDDKREKGTEEVDAEHGPWRAASEEPRLIVEALVVRKLSLDEAFLDFEVFSLQ